MEQGTGKFSRGYRYFLHPHASVSLMKGCNYFYFLASVILLAFHHRETGAVQTEVYLIHSITFTPLLLIFVIEIHALCCLALIFNKAYV